VTPGGRRLTEVHRGAQVRLGAQTVARLAQVWPLLDPDDIDSTVDGWLTAARAVVASQHQSSARLAAAYTRTLRILETGDLDDWDDVDLPLFDPTPVDVSLTVTGPVSIKNATGRGIALATAAATALAASSAAGMRHSLSGARDLIRDTVASDPKAKGFTRETSGNACQFCSSLAGITFPSGEAFPAHDGCSCMAAPAY
jgi:hypothetical protein